MPKQNNTKPIAETTATDEQGNVLVADILLPEVHEKYQESLLTSLKQSLPDLVIDKLEAECNQLQIHGTGDKEGYSAVKTKIGDIKSTAAALEKKRKELKDPFKRMGEAIDAEAKRLDARLRGIQTKLEEKRKAIDDAIQAEKEAEERRLEARYADRVKQITDLGVTFNTVTFQVGLVSATPKQVRSLEDADFEVLLSKFESEIGMLKAEHERKAKEEEARRQRQEAEAAAAKEAADKAAAEKAAAEAEAAAAKAELERMRAELEAMKAAQAPKPEPAPIKPEPAPVQPEPTQTQVPSAQATGRTQRSSWAPTQPATTPTPQAEPAPVQPQQERSFTLTQSQIMRQRVKSFDKCRAIIIERVTNKDEKLTRQSLIDFINSLDAPTLCNFN